MVLAPVGNNDNSNDDGLREVVEVEINGRTYYFDSATDYSEPQGIATLRRGLTEDDSLEQWYSSVQKGADERRDVVIIFSRPSREGTEHKRRNLYGCLPSGYDLSTFAAEKPGIESISLEYQSAEWA